MPGTITIAGGGDSFYEYLIKNYILQTDKNEDHKLTWQNSVESIEEYMLSPTSQNPDIKYVAMIGNNSVYYTSQELICYWPGNILLGITQITDEAKRTKYRKFADTFYDSCIEAWVKTETSIAPETWNWIPQDDALETKLNGLFENSLKSSKTPKKSHQKRVGASNKKTVNRSFYVGNSIYDLRPGNKKRTPLDIVTCTKHIYNRNFREYILLLSFTWRYKVPEYGRRIV
ncbi:hypothetical protein HPULCUR_006814 [Helicostylum pulchrum]|uniref:alpha-1,2-Mannosidase n=1 Tax=Helicostylum pulchrum TaxID=562976 RepID=A0ABP9Y480_9FUNG